MTRLAAVGLTVTVAGTIGVAAAVRRVIRKPVSWVEGWLP